MADENFESEFSMNQKVKIEQGFYKGYYGIIKAYEVKTGKYEVEIELNNQKKRISCKRDDIRAQKGLFGF